MGTISIHGIDANLEKALKKQARNNQQSLSRYIKGILQTAVSKSARVARRHQHFARFSGIWSQEEYQRFTQAASDFEKIDAEDWR